MTKTNAHNTATHNPENGNTENESLHIRDIIQNSLSRRDFVQMSLGVGAALSLGSNIAFAGKIGFKPVIENQNNGVTIPEGYEWHKLMSWGDALYNGQQEAKIKRGAPFTFTRDEQEKRVGTCNDMFALFSKNHSYPWKKTAEEEYIVCSNNEYVIPYLLVAPKNNDGCKPTNIEVEAMYAAQGVTIAEVTHNPTNGSWVLKKNDLNGGAINRRITPFTETIFDGPAKDHKWVLDAKQNVNKSESLKGKNSKSPEGILCGTMQNCAGGYTPWGTYLTAEENIDNMYFTTNEDAEPLKAALDTSEYVIDKASFGYNNSWRFGGPEQFDLSKNPYGPSLYGWIVEIDPHDPTWQPRKHTALGRKKNECATCVLSENGHAVTYTGDDQVNEFVYKFISSNTFDAENRTKNRELLSDGKLLAAKFNDDGTGKWIEITLEAANAAPRKEGETAFADLADLKIRTREAARRLGATPMDRPEDVEAPKDEYFKGKGHVYVVCTGNQSAEGIEGNAANPRRKTNGNTDKNYTGHIVRIFEDNNNHEASTFKWEIFIMGGDHSKEVVFVTRPNGLVSNLSSWKDKKPSTIGDRFAMPDNITFDNYNNAWITTDGTPDNFKCNDGVYVIDTNAPAPRTVKRFLTGPVGCEVTGPYIAPDNKTFFCGFQHVGSDSINNISYRGYTSTPYSTFPNKVWPRDTIIYVRRKDGGIVGS